MEKEVEVNNILRILKETKKAILESDSLKLKELSNQTIHSASTLQDTDSISIAILVYSLSKIIERKDRFKIKKWNLFVQKINSYLSLAEKALKEDRIDKLTLYLEQTRKTITSISNIKPIIQDVIRKASINKASKIYEHGISMEQTANILGITQWELSEYAGQTNIAEVPLNKTQDVKQRAKMAMEFFS